MLGALIRRTVRRSASRGEMALDSTTFSLTTQVPRPADQRADKRLLLMLPVAKLTSEYRQDLCRIRNISAGGLMAEVTTQPAVGTRFFIELSSDQRIPGEVVWTRGNSIGVKFDHDVDLRELLAERRPVAGYTRRPPRLEVTCGATVRIGSLYHRVEVRDISLGGIKVAISDWQCVGKPVQITIESFRMVKGKVRWYRGGQAGIVFDRPLAFEELAAWMAKRVEIASLKAGAWDKPGH